METNYRTHYTIFCLGFFCTADLKHKEYQFNILLVDKWTSAFEEGIHSIIFDTILLTSSLCLFVLDFSKACFFSFLNCIHFYVSY